MTMACRSCNFDDVVEAQVEVGLGPLHTQFDDKGYAYTSLFLEPSVARWTLGGDFSDLHEEEDWTLVTKTPVQYNVGHIAAAEGDTVSPDGRYLGVDEQMGRRSLRQCWPAAAPEFPVAGHQ